MTRNGDDGCHQSLKFPEKFPRLKNLYKKGRSEKFVKKLQIKTL